MRIWPNIFPTHAHLDTKQMHKHTNEARREGGRKGGPNRNQVQYKTFHLTLYFAVCDIANLHTNIYLHSTHNKFFKKAFTFSVSSGGMRLGMHTNLLCFLFPTFPFTVITTYILDNWITQASFNIRVFLIGLFTMYFMPKLKGDIRLAKIEAIMYCQPIIGVYSVLQTMQHNRTTFQRYISLEEAEALRYPDQGWPLV